MRCFLYTLEVLVVGIPVVAADGIAKLFGGKGFLSTADPEKQPMTGWIICPPGTEDCVDCNKQQSAKTQEVLPMQSDSTAITMGAAVMTVAGILITYYPTGDMLLSIMAGSFMGAIGGLIAASVTARPAKQAQTVEPVAELTPPPQSQPVQDKVIEETVPNCGCPKEVATQEGVSTALRQANELTEENFQITRWDLIFADIAKEREEANQIKVGR